MMDYERQIQDLKMLRKIGEFLNNYGIFETEYEGAVIQLGDAVQMYKSKDTIIVDKRIPQDPKDPVGSMIRYLMDNLEWRRGGQLVIQVVNGTGFIYGYKVGDMREDLWKRC